MPSVRSFVTYKLQNVAPKNANRNAGFLDCDYQLLSCFYTIKRWWEKNKNTPSKSDRKIVVKKEWENELGPGLQKRGLPHPDHCLLCDQEQETVQHILPAFVFARQFWFAILQSLNLVALVPNRRTTSLMDWWKKSWRKISKLYKRDLTRWLSLELGSSRNIGMLVSLKDRLLTSSLPCNLFQMNYISGKLQVLRGLGSSA